MSAMNLLPREKTTETICMFLCIGAILLIVWTLP